MHLEKLKQLIIKNGWSSNKRDQYDVAVNNKRVVEHFMLLELESHRFSELQITADVRSNC